MNKGEHGYSLVELLVVLALIGFIAIAMSGGVRFGARAWERSGAIVEAIERTDGAQNLLRAVFQRVVPRYFDPNVPADPGLFTGTRDSVSFAAQAPSAFGAGGLMHFQLRVVRDGALQRLDMTWRGASGATPAQTQVLVAGAREIGLSFAARDQDGGLSWTDSWTGQTGAPALVLVRATFPAGSHMRWPALIVRPRISRDPSCIYDPVSFGCRHA